METVFCTACGNCLKCCSSIQCRSVTANSHSKQNTRLSPCAVALYELSFVLKLSEIPQMLLTLKTGLSTTGCNSAAVFTPLIFVVSLTVQWKATASYRTVAHFYFNFYNFYFIFILTFILTFITGDTVVQNLYNFLSYVEQRGDYFEEYSTCFWLYIYKNNWVNKPFNFFYSNVSSKISWGCCHFILLHMLTQTHAHTYSSSFLVSLEVQSNRQSSPELCPIQDLYVWD